MRHLYIALHQGTDAAPTAFSASTDSLDSILRQPSSYPLCDIVSHRPGSTTHFPVSNSHDVPLLTQPGDSTNASPYLPSHGGTTVPQGPQRAEQANIIVGPLSQSNQTTTSIIGGTSHTPLATPLTNPVHSSPPPTLADTSPTGGVATVLQDIPSAASLSYTLEVGTQQDIVAPWAEPDIGENWFTASMPASPVHTPTLAPLQASTPHVLNKSSASCDTGPAPTSDPLLPTPSIVGFSISTSPRPSCVPLMPNAKFFSLLGNTPPSRPSGNTTLLRLRARGLVNAGSMCFVNTVLQLLVYPPPVWDLFKELGDLNGRQVAGGAGTGAGSTPLVDATVRLFEEFMIEEKDPPPAQQPPQQTAGGKAREGEEEIKCDAVDPFEPTYMYDAMKEGRQLKNLLVSQQRDAGEFFRLYLDALDEELLALLASISAHESPTAAQEHEVTQSNQSEVGKRGFTSVRSPLVRIFGGKFRSTVRAPNQPDTVTVEDWRSLQLDIQHDSVHAIEDALARISHLQPVQLGPSGLNVASQQIHIEALPPVLVLHLKRFLYDAIADGIVKISKPVKFASELEIPLEIMAPVVAKSAESAHYKLYGVLYHHGKSTGSGHYTVDVLHQNGDSGGGEGWLHIDDESVGAVRHEDVFVFGGYGNERVDDRCAYMLFYCRTASAWT
ncbi:hypothetical protein DFH94DRAFT_674368 [Russula ochroleuca]|uniref:ubiquitinyl hydrolase 1 n=1 Tax=Russula ochroleuca TaxID=152965 RepID=A0A9P5MMK2_9AGAM|nr:hypothetical protein DFH94DRAFT_674368 [Russula ochroleuca]